jgi:hypothetical protein
MNMKKAEKACPYMFPDCLSDRVRYMRVEPIDLSFGRTVNEKGYSIQMRQAPTYVQITLIREEISQSVGVLREER